MEKYEVKLRNQHDKSRWSLMFSAENFSHAEEQANDYLRDQDALNLGWEIIEIQKDYG